MITRQSDNNRVTIQKLRTKYIIERWLKRPGKAYVDLSREEPIHLCMGMHLIEG